MKLYGRKVSQIYLCHNNVLNAKYLSEILRQLKMKQYQFVSLEQAMMDPAYRQTDERVKWMKEEPIMTEVELMYSKLVSKK